MPLGMRLDFRFLLIGAAVCLSLLAEIDSTWAQAGGAPVKPPAAAKPASVSAEKGHRALAPGVEITIPPDRQENDTFSAHDVVEILNGVPNLKWNPKTEPGTKTLADIATGTIFRHNIWYLELTFKPVRMIWADIPQPTGKMQRKLIWYMVYHVRNKGGHSKPVRRADGAFDIQTVDHEVRFLPQFVLESRELGKAYLDRLIPAAVTAIVEKEDPTRKLLNSVEISVKPLPVSTDKADHSVWGVVTWEDVDPRIDFFSVSIQGLTNAYRWTDPPGEFKMGDPPGKGRVLTEKTLVLNFWRPGDEFVEDKRVIRYGIPGQVDYQWVYR